MKKNKNLIFLSVTIALFLFTIEISLWLFGVQFPSYLRIDTYPYNLIEYVKNPSQGNVLANPLFGHVNNPNNEKMNNYGFKSPLNYPYERNENDFVIGVYGGSVAEDNAGYLQEELSKNLELSGCESNFVVLNLASGAMKQPQQLHSMIHSLHWIDMAINIDGFNDLTLDLGLALPVEYSHYYVNAYPRGLKLSIAKQFMYFARYAQFYTIRSAFVFNHLSKLKLFSLAYWSSMNTAQAIYDYLNTVGEGVPMVYQPNQKIMKRSRLEQLKASYKRNTLYQNTLAQAADKPFYVFIQPNQYLPDSKKFMSAIEKKIAINPAKQSGADDDPFRYLEIFNLASELKSSGVNIIDITKVFYDDTRVVFRDDCCHFNQLGNELLAKRIIEEIKPELTSQGVCKK